MLMIVVIEDGFFSKFTFQDCRDFLGTGSFAVRKRQSDWKTRPIRLDYEGIPASERNTDEEEGQSDMIRPSMLDARVRLSDGEV